MKWEKAYSIVTLLSYGLPILLAIAVIVLLFYIFVKKNKFKDAINETKYIVIVASVLLISIGYFMHDMKHRVYDKEDTINSIMTYSGVLLKSDTMSNQEFNEFKSLYYSDATVTETKNLLQSGSKAISLSVYNCLTDAANYFTWGNWDETIKLNPLTIKYAQQFDSITGEDYGSHYLKSFTNDITTGEIGERARISKSLADSVFLNNIKTKLLTERDEVESIYKRFFNEDLLKN